MPCFFVIKTTSGKKNPEKIYSQSNGQSITDNFGMGINPIN
jgi:hypothetical protein